MSLWGWEKIGGKSPLSTDSGPVPYTPGLGEWVEMNRDLVETMSVGGEGERLEASQWEVKTLNFLKILFKSFIFSSNFL